MDRADQEGAATRDAAALHEAPDDASSEALAGRVQASGIRSVHFVAWRDLDDPEAGGSEIHAHEIASRWASAGLEVTVRTSAIAGLASTGHRSGYEVARRSGRYRVFPSTIREGLRRRNEPGDAVVEVWNGMPFFSPIWHRGPRITFLHHVHE